MNECVFFLHRAATDRGRPGAGVRDQPPEQHQADPHRGAQETAKVRADFVAWHDTLLIEWPLFEAVGTYRQQRRNIGSNPEMFSAH